MDYIFHVCVSMLLDLARVTGLSYEAVNVIIFCVIWPLGTLFLILKVKHQRVEIKTLKRALRRTDCCR